MKTDKEKAKLLDGFMSKTTDDTLKENWHILQQHYYSGDSTDTDWLIIALAFIAFLGLSAVFTAGIYAICQ